MKYYLKLLSLPLSLLISFIFVFIIWRVFSLPSTETLISIIGVFFQKYGVIVILVSACIEGMLLFGGYFPGVFVIFISVVTSESLSEAIFRISIGTAGLIIAHIINYFLGKYGWHKLFEKFGLKSSIESKKSNLVKNGAFAIFGSYWLPSMSALTDTAAGILLMPFKKFLLFSITASIFWNFLVGFIVYYMGNKALIFATSGSITELLIDFSIIFIWVVILLIIDLKKN